MAHVDWLILTAANQMQARGYEAQLQARQERGSFDPQTSWRVIADPGDRRVGSGGSTLWVLFEIAREMLRRRPHARGIADLFADLRVLVVHSGGDSRRLVAYTAQGKVFLPLPCSTQGGAPATLFDLIAADLAKLPSPPGGQVLLAAGDVLLTFHRQEADFSRPGVVGVAYPGPVDRGSKHGVYVADRDGRVTDFLQKPDEATARARGAVDAVGRVLVDTGLVSLDPPTVQRWLAAAGVRLSRGTLSIGKGLLHDVLEGRTPSIDLYEQVLMAMAPSLDLSSYLRAVARPSGDPLADLAHQKRLTQLFRDLHDLPFHVNVLPYCEFFHVGTSRELLSNVGTLSRTAKMYGFANFDRAVVADRASVEGAFVYNSILHPSKVRIGAGVLLEAVHASKGVTVELPGRNIVVGWPAEAAAALRLPEGWGLACLPVKAGPGSRSRGNDWAVVLFGIDDDFKTSLAAGGTLGNQPMEQFLTQHHLSPGDLWRDPSPDRCTLWDARFWTVGPIEQALAQTLWICEPRGPIPAGWRQRPRQSVKELLGRIDHQRLLCHRDQIQRLGELFSLDQRLAGDAWLPAARVVSLMHSDEEATLAIKQIDRMVRRDANPSSQARLHWLARDIVQQFPRAAAASVGPECERAAFDAVARTVAQNIALPDKPRPAAILHDQVVWVTTPVRLDFAGGWSDTPPICTELGGTVLNAAVTLNGQYPVQVIAKLAERPVITLSSMDLGQRVELAETSAILDYRDPTDWAALPKAAMVLAGLCPGDPRQPLARWLGKLGGGLDITLFSALPKGSGLGTSSVLGAAMLACLARVTGDGADRDRLIARTSMLEQMMTTGGGWQDQVGGITPGVKLIRTQPGPDQTPSLHWTVFDLSPSGPLHGRLLLYYTGYKRMARNILQKVVGRYLARDPECVAIINRLKDAAEQMKNDLGSRDADAFGRGVELYWSLKKQLDPGSTNPKIEALLRPVQKYLVGNVLPGAGGGGFVFMVARDPDAAQKVRRLLAQRKPNPLARFFDFEVDPKGLSVTVL